MVRGDYVSASTGYGTGGRAEFMTGKVPRGGNIRPEGATGSAAVAYADGHLYFRYQNGVMKLIEASPEGYNETGSFKIPSVRKPSWSHPVIYGGKLYLREQDNLYVYHVRE